MPDRLADPSDTDRGQAQVRVWDLAVRVFHWSLVVTFFVAYFTEGDVLTLHVWSGYAVGALVVLRILWGFVGPKHARFADFVYPPAKIWPYIRALLAFRAKRYIGHSPAGGAMVLILMAGLLGTVWTGVQAYAPDGNSEFWGEFHEGVASVMLALVVVHIAGVLFASLAHRENLVRAMVSGYKRGGSV